MMILREKLSPNAESLGLTLEKTLEHLEYARRIYLV